MSARLKFCAWACAVWGALFVVAAPDPLAVFEKPPQRAKTGVWWHWMGCNVTRAGIVRDLDWFKDVGIGSATIFGMADVCTPWATSITNSPTQGLVAFTPDWWRLVRFACEEAAKRGIELGLHNCPGYTSTGGPWIPPRLAMRELVFNVTNAETQISLAAHADFPVHNETTGVFEKPEIPSRRTDLQDIAVVGGVRIAHIPMGAFTQPNQWEAFGLECDKMNPEAVAFHLDHVIADLKKYIGPQIGKGLKFILLDSYEAGRPTWTPRMREAFKSRRGYDPLPFLPVLGGFKVADAAAEKKFKADYERTIKDLYRDVLFKTMHEKLSALGLDFACEPYTGPFDSRECAAYVDRLMTEFWFDPKRDRGLAGALGWNQWTGPHGVRHNVVEAEAFTGQPANCQWTETPLQLKACGDQQFARGVNRFTLHTCPLQPWDDAIRPGITMGRWGTHFGRTQTWAKTGKGWFDYLNRCQALLQWGAPSAAKISGNDIQPAGTPISALAREADGTLVFFVVNHSNHPASMSMGLPAGCAKAPEWFDPVTGRTAPLALRKNGAPIQLPAGGSGFLVLRKPAGSLMPTADSAYFQTADKPYSGAEFPSELCAFMSPWTVSFGSTTVPMDNLVDWTKHANPAVKYFSGTAVYRRIFNIAGGRFPTLLTLGNCNGQLAGVKINGVDLGTVWCEPYEVRIPAEAVHEGDNVLEIEFTNVWANRLIGDEQEPADCAFVKAPFPGGWYLSAFPDWFVKKAPRPSAGRKCFTDWNYFTKDSPLVPSGLLGPVRFHRLDPEGCAATNRPIPELMRVGCGAIADSIGDWEHIRRPEIFRTMFDNVYGQRPVERPEDLKFEQIGADEPYLDGLAVKKLIRGTYSGPGGTESFTLAAWIPNDETRVPAFVYLSPRPAATVDDPQGPRPVYTLPAGYLVSRGYAAVAICDYEFAPDFHLTPQEATNGVFKAFGPSNLRTRQDSEWGILSAWAWGASRALDWIQTEPRLEAHRVGVVGLSRNGKAALVAGATDSRFALTVSCCSGMGGAKFNHMDCPGSESVAAIMKPASFWFCPKFATWIGHDQEMPFDQHFLLALMAPRLLYVSSATQDDWAGPRGEFESCVQASPAWDLYGEAGLVHHGFPSPDRPLAAGNVGYHLRTGPHAILLQDWEGYLDFADGHGWTAGRKCGMVKSMVQGERK